MKKKEKFILIGIVLVIACLFMYIKFKPFQHIQQKQNQVTDQVTGKEQKKVPGLAKPTEKPKGKWVGIVHRHEVIKWFDSGVDGDYVVQGDYGKFGVECKNGKWHAHGVDCPNHLCEKMGWDDGSLLVPISCIPNDIYVGTSDWIESYVN